MEPIKVKVDQSKSRNRYDMEDLIIDACMELEQRIKDEEIDILVDDINDTIHEIADNSVPIYYYDIGQFAAHNSCLMTIKSELNPEGTPHDQIQSNIYSEIVDGLHAYIAKKEKDEEDEK